MLAIYLYREGDRTQRILTAKREIVVGGAQSDVPVSGTDARCKLQVRAAGCFLVHEAGTVYVNGKQIDRATPLYDTDKVYVGPYSFMIETLERAPDPNEERLLADIAAGDDASRIVYADWLEENGDVRRAEFLRCQETLRALAEKGDPSFVEQSRRLRQLAVVVDLDWRMKVARAPVESCRASVRFEFVCPKQWSELAETGQPDIRHCDLCQQPVHYCASIEEARNHAWFGRCVAIDPSNERSPGDLERPPAVRPGGGAVMMMGAIAPPPRDPRGNR